MLLVGVFCCVVLILMTGSALFYLNGDEGDESFESIPKSLFMSMLLLTGQGIDYEGKKYGTFMLTIISLTSLMSVAIFAIPAAVMAWGFEEEALRMQKLRLRRKNKIQLAKRLGALLCFVFLALRYHRCKIAQPSNSFMCNLCRC